MFYAEDYYFHYPKRSGSAWQLKNKEMAMSAIKAMDNYQHVIVSDNNRLPVLSLLFYKPDLIELIQPDNGYTGNQNYQWISHFDKFEFANTDDKLSTENTLVIK